MIKSLTPSALLVNNLLAKPPSQSLGAAGSPGFTAGSPGECRGPAGLSGREALLERSGWQNVHSTASIPAGKADSTGNSPKHGNSKQDAVMADKCRGISKGGKSPAPASHKPDGTRIFESIIHYHRLAYLPTKAGHILDLPVAFSGLNALTKFLKRFWVCPWENFGRAGGHVP